MNITDGCACRCVITKHTPFIVFNFIRRGEVKSLTALCGLGLSDAKVFEWNFVGFSRMQAFGGHLERILRLLK